MQDITGHIKALAVGAIMLTVAAALVGVLALIAVHAPWLYAVAIAAIIAWNFGSLYLNIKKA